MITQLTLEKCFQQPNTWNKEMPLDIFKKIYMQHVMTLLFFCLLRNSCKVFTLAFTCHNLCRPTFRPLGHSKQVNVNNTTNILYVFLFTQATVLPSSPRGLLWPILVEDLTFHLVPCADLYGDVFRPNYKTTESSCPSPTCANLFRPALDFQEDFARVGCIIDD